MSTRTAPLKRLAAGTAALATLATLSIGTAPARALAPSVAAPNVVQNPTEAAKGAGWLLTQKQADGHYKTFSNVDVDVLIALAATGQNMAELNRINGLLKADAKTIVAGGAGATAKLAIAAAVMGEDARNYGGVNLVKVLTDAVAADPSVGGTWGIYTQPYVVIALARNNVPVPQALVDAMLKGQPGGKGGFGMDDGTGFKANLDATGPVLQALTLLPQTTAVKASIAEAITWSKTQMVNGTYFPSEYSPNNTTGLMASAFIATKQDASKPLAWLKGQQARTRTGGFAPSLTGTDPELFATVQALPALAGASFATVTMRPDPTAAGDATGDGIADVWTVTADGKLQLNRGYAKRGLHLVGTRATGWQGVSYLAQMADPVDNAGTALLSRRSDGNLYQNRVVGLGYLLGDTRVGSNWAGMDQIIPVGNLAGGSAQYVVARRKSDGGLFLYQVRSYGLLSKGQIGKNWNGMRQIFSAGDYNRDGRADVQAIRQDGTLWVYTSRADGTIAEGRQAGHGWSSFVNVTVAGDMSGNGTRDIVGRRADGAVFTYDNLNGRWGTARQIASGMATHKLMA